MYSSTDLYNWTYEGVILHCATDPEHPLYGAMRFENHNTHNFERCSYIWLPVDFPTTDTVKLVYRKSAFKGGKRPCNQLF